MSEYIMIIIEYLSCNPELIYDPKRNYTVSRGDEEGSFRVVDELISKSSVEVLDDPNLAEPVKLKLHMLKVVTYCIR